MPTSTRPVRAAKPPRAAGPSRGGEDRMLYFATVHAAIVHSL